MINLQDFLNELKLEMKRKKISQKEVCDKLQLSHPTMTNILLGKHGTFDTLNKIINYVNSKEIWEREKSNENVLGGKYEI